MHMITTSSGSAVAGGARIWLVPCVLFLAACALYGINLDRVPHPDELYQILAAQGLLATGEPRIAEGLYTRAYAQTWLIAQSLALAGDNLTAARLSSVVGIAGTVTLLFVWLRAVAGPAAAWTAAILFALSPFAVLAAQFARIYGVQTLAFFVGSLCLYQAASAAGPLWRRAAWALVALPPLLLALHLQPTTLLGCVGLGLWLAGAIGLPWLRDPAVPARRKRLVLLGLVAAGALVLLAAVATGLLADFWHSYRWTPLFNREQQDAFWFYHLWYTLLYPSLWPLTGLLALVAIAVHPRAASMALLVFAVGFLLNSFAGPKSLRYIAYAQPFLFVLWGIGLVSLWPAPRPGPAASPRLEAIAGPPFPGWAGWAGCLVAGALLFLALANPAWLRTATLLADINVPGEAPGRLAGRQGPAPAMARAGRRGGDHGGAGGALFPRPLRHPLQPVQARGDRRRRRAARVRARPPHRPAADRDPGIAGAGLRPPRSGAVHPPEPAGTFPASVQPGGARADPRPHRPGRAAAARATSWPTLGSARPAPPAGGLRRPAAAAGAARAQPAP